MIGDTRPADRALPEHKGWCFGLPPGISQQRRPLDPNSGYPLMHGFTLLLPEDYRVHGPDLVALSFFAVSFDHGGGAILDEAMRALFDDPGDKPPDDPRLLPFWRAIKVPSHPHLHRMEDVLGDSYAVIWLTQRELEGPLCAPPHLPDNPEIDRPDWLEVGTATNFGEDNTRPRWISDGRVLDLLALGQLPKHDVTFNRALTWTPRVHDGNAGKAAREQDASEYKEVFKLDHIGGTMRSLQATPQFTQKRRG